MTHDGAPQARLQRRALQHRARAERFRVIAEGNRNQAARRALLALATDGDRIAHRIEASAGRVDTALAGLIHPAFRAAPHPYLLLTPKLEIANANAAYLSATMTALGDIVGARLFEVFPDNPKDPAADGVRKLGASLGRVLARGQADAMARQRYDVRRPDGVFEERWWQPINVPILDPKGVLVGLLHHVEDVTAAVKRAAVA